MKNIVIEYPTLDSSSWKEYEGYYIIKPTDKVVFFLGNLIPSMDELQIKLNQMGGTLKDNFNTICKTVTDDIHTIGTIYQLHNIVTNEFYLGYTTFNLIDYVVSAIYNHKHNSSKLQFANLLTSPDSLYTTYVCAIEYVKFSDKGQIIKRKEEWRNYFNSDDKFSTEMHYIFMGKSLNVSLDDRYKFIRDIQKKYIKKYNLQDAQYDDGKIYKITNKIDGRVYIGSTTQPLKTRFIGHKSSKHINTKLYLDILKIGADNFEIALIENFSCNSEFELHAREDYWIIKYNSIESGYNSKYALIESKLGLNEPKLNHQCREILRKLIFARCQLENFTMYYDGASQFKEFNVVFYIREKNKDKYFIDKSICTLSASIKNMYTSAINKIIDKKCHNSKLYDFLMEIPFNDLDIVILKRYSLATLKDMTSDVNKYRIQYDSYIKGLNKKTVPLYFAKK